LEKKIIERFLAYQEKGRRRWVQDNRDDLPMSSSDVGHLAYDPMVFNSTVKRPKFGPEHATE
jgi:hypothetical protein